MEVIKLGIVDDNLQLANQLISNFRLFDHINVMLLASNGRDLLDQLDKTTIHPEVILMDVEMPVMDGIQTTRQVKQLNPDIKVIMLSVFDQDDKVFEAVMAGASGYILKDEAPVKIIEAVENVLHGGASMSSLVAMKVLSLIRSQERVEFQNKTPIQFGLSKREIEILELLSDGKDYLRISESLFISPHTVKKHIANLYDKLHVNNRAEAVRIAVKNRWV